jgi:hypothetical protein
MSSRLTSLIYGESLSLIAKAGLPFTFSQLFYDNVSFLESFSGLENSPPAYLMSYCASYAPLGASLVTYMSD